MYINNTLDRLQRYFVLICILSCPVLTFSATTAADPCNRIVDTSGDNWTIAIWNSGRYCIGQDLNQSDPIFKLPHQAVPKDPLLLIFQSNVIADLGSHQLKSSVIHREGVFVRALKPSPKQEITIRNGVITTTSGPAVFMVDAFDDGEDARFGRNMTIASSQGNLTTYRPTEFILEDLTLKADNHVIIMQGMKNIIRHCKIIGGNGTVNVFGPQLIFEDNEIILHASPQANVSDDAPVALYLEDAADSVVRNNRIVIEGRVPGSEAIVLKNSPNVTLSGNTVTGADSIYKLLDENSSAKATSNTLTR